VLHQSAKQLEGSWPQVLEQLEEEERAKREKLEFEFQCNDIFTDTTWLQGASPPRPRPCRLVSILVVAAGGGGYIVAARAVRRSMDGGSGAAMTATRALVCGVGRARFSARRMRVLSSSSARHDRAR
jgi:hypothetical protein